MKNKRYIAIIFCLSFIMILTACGGNVRNVKIINVKSNIYTDEDIKSAENVVLHYFKKEFKGCKLIKLQYIGDDENKGFLEYGPREVIILISEFKTDSKVVDGSFNPNDIYTGWQWNLVRNNNGKWKLVDYGY